MAEANQQLAGNPPHHAYNPPVLRQLALRVIVPMALVALVLFGLLAWETARSLPPGSDAFAVAMLRNGLLLLAGLALVTASGWLVASRAVQPVGRLQCSET